MDKLAIDAITEQDATWGMASHDWVVGGAKAVAGDAEVIVTQALGPDPEEGEARRIKYAATVNGQNVAWNRGATSLHEVQHGFGPKATYREVTIDYSVYTMLYSK